MLSPCDMFPPNLKSEVSVPSPSLLRLRMMQCVLLLGQVAEQAATTQKVDQCHPLPPEEDGGAQQQPQCVHYLPPTQRFISVKPPPTHAPHSSYDASPLSVHRVATMPSPCHRVPTMLSPCPRSSYDALPLSTEFLRCSPPVHRAPTMLSPCPQSSYDAILR